MRYPNLYKRDSQGNVRVWSMESRETPTPAHRTISGILHGTLVESNWTETNPKNVGRANATTAIEQAHQEILSAYAIKKRKWYVEDVADVDVPTTQQPMLAKTWNDEKRPKLDLYSQPKLDGMRCIARADGLWTRTGKRITSCQHIEDQLRPLFTRPEYADVVLDGELYNHTHHARFNDLMSLIRKEKMTPEDRALTESVVQYHIYDIADEGLTFRERVQLLHKDLSKYFPNESFCRLVSTTRVEEYDALDEIYQQYMQQGYEGQMVRIPDAIYEPKRSSSLLKRKDFFSDEFPVLDMHEGAGNWAGAVKTLSIQLPEGVVGSATLRGSYEVGQRLLDSGAVPTWATVRHFGYGPDGKLRFPVVVDYGWGDGRED